MFPAIKNSRMTGDEAIILPDGQEIGRVIDFWRWAHSDLISNAERGALAEYLVACALGVNREERIAWDKFDLISQEGITIEVKTSGYIQTWEQKELSKLVFGIRPTFGWDSKTNEYGKEQKRQADIYVFCVHKHTEQETINPLEISQWDFYLMPSKLLDKKFGKQKTTSLSALIKAGAELCCYNDLRKRICELV